MRRAGKCLVSPFYLNAKLKNPLSSPTHRCAIKPILKRGKMK